MYPTRATFSSRIRMLGAVALVAILPACGASGGTAPQSAEDRLRIGQLILQDSNGDVMYVHHGHWHGAPRVPLNGAATLAIWIYQDEMGPDDHDAPPREKWISLSGRPEYGVRAVVEDTTVASWTGDRTSGRLAGRNAGATRVSFVVQRGSTTIYEAPPLNFSVRAP